MPADQSIIQKKRKDPVRKQGLCRSAKRGCKNSSAYSLIEKSLSHKSLCAAKIMFFGETYKFTKEILN